MAPALAPGDVVTVTRIDRLARSLLMHGFAAAMMITCFLFPAVASISDRLCRAFPN
jgi:hypothetical protein